MRIDGDASVCTGCTRRCIDDDVDAGSDEGIEDTAQNRDDAVGFGEECFGEKRDTHALLLGWLA